MRRFVITISQYGKNLIKTSSSSRKTGLSSLPMTARLAASLRQGYLREVSPWAPSRCFTDTHMTMSLLPPTQEIHGLLYAQNGVRVLVTDYCSTSSDVDASYRRSKENGFLSFVADKRNLAATLKYPNAQYNANFKDINTVADAENFLYLINSKKFLQNGSLSLRSKIRITIWICFTS